MLKLKNLKISSITNPLGITEKPYFSYVLESDKQDTVQTEYSVTVKSNDKTVWTTAEKTDKSVYIAYGGELESATRYDVKISVKDNHGESATICGYFETAFLNNDELKNAKWVKSTLPIFNAEKGLGKQPPATLFGKKFDCKKQPVSARLYCTCHGVYIPYINGQRFGGNFAPEHSVYDKVLFYQTYDVTNMLKSGTNEFSLYVGDGWYLGVKTTPRMNNYERRHAVLFRLDIVYSDGTTDVVVSDDGVKCAYGPVLCSDLFSGEIYDANKKFDGFSPAEIADYGYDNLVSQIDCSAVCEEELSVKDIIITPKGETIVDFGRVIAGRVRMRVDAPKGTEIRLVHTEVLDQYGNFYQNTDMPDGGVEQTDVYISDGTPREYEPLFTYHGFRYVMIESSVEIKKEDFTALCYGTPKDNLSEFFCSDERLNRLYANIRNSQRSNMISIPTDCPQREKAGWTGDIALYAKTALLNEDATEFLRRWLRSVRADQGKNGAIPQIVPYDGGYPMSEVFFGAMFDEADTFGVAGWSDCCIYVPWAVYMQTGNIIPLKENYATMEKWCKYISEHCALPKKNAELPYEYDKYLWNNSFQQGDWLVPSIAKNDVQYEDAMTGNLTFKVEFAYEYSVPMYGYYSFTLMQKISDLLGFYDKAKYYGEFAANMKRAIQAVYFDEHGLKTKYMGGYVLALAFGLVPNELKETVIMQLVNSIENNGYCLDTGFLSTPYLLETLCNIGRSDLAYKLLFQNKCPSWLFEVDRGATSVWESWESFDDDGTPKKISFNHYAFGCVDEFIVERVCGIKATDVGFKAFTVRPDIDCPLEYAERKLLTQYGEIYVKWEKHSGKFKLKCKVPCNAHAEIIMPSGTTYKVGSGVYDYSEKMV